MCVHVDARLSTSRTNSLHARVIVWTFVTCVGMSSVDVQRWGGWQSGTRLVWSSSKREKPPFRALYNKQHVLLCEKRWRMWRICLRVCACVVCCGVMCKGSFQPLLALSRPVHLLFAVLNLLNVDRVAHQLVHVRHDIRVLNIHKHEGRHNFR